VCKKLTILLTVRWNSHPGESPGKVWVFLRLQWGLRRGLCGTEPYRAIQTEGIQQYERSDDFAVESFLHRRVIKKGEGEGCMLFEEEVVRVPRRPHARIPFGPDPVLSAAGTPPMQ